MSIGRNVVNIVRGQGVLALYSGLSASLLRQLSYSTTRFAVYEVRRQPGRGATVTRHRGVWGTDDNRHYL